MPRKEYEFGKELGRGAFGVVYKVKKKKSGGSEYVCKCISLRGMDKKMQGEAKGEVVLLKKVSKGCEYIVQYVESFLEAEELHIVMEFCANGDLSSALQARAASKKPLAEEEVWKWLIQVGWGLKWLHNNRILHRDIKPLNVFLTSEDDARIGDLGVARMLRKDVSFAKTLIGTPFYMAPEICNAQAYNDRSDVWAYGCVLYEMCCLRKAFEAKNTAALIMKILEGKYTPVSDEYSAELRGFIRSCLELEPKKRVSMVELLERPAVQVWTSKLDVGGGNPGDKTMDPSHLRAWKKWRQTTEKIGRLQQKINEALDPPTREVWDKLYMLFRAKMASDVELSAKDYEDIQKHVYEELKVEDTDFIMRVAEVISLEVEAEQWQNELLVRTTNATNGDANDGGATSESAAADKTNIMPRNASPQPRGSAGVRRANTGSTRRLHDGIPT